MSGVASSPILRAIGCFSSTLEPSAHVYTDFDCRYTDFDTDYTDFDRHYTDFDANYTDFVSLFFVCFQATERHEI